MLELYHEVLIRPILNLLVWIMDVLPGNDLGFAIITVTILVRLLLLPLSAKSLKAQKTLQELQPQMNEIKEKYKDDKKKQSEELMRFYQKSKVNPLSSCLPILVQLPIILALYQVFQTGLTDTTLSQLYTFVSRPESIDTIFLGLVNLSVPNAVFAVLAGATQFIQAKYLLPKRPPAAVTKKEDGKTKSSSDAAADVATSLTKQMTYILPAMTGFIALSLPSGLALYWITTTLVAIIQQIFIFRTVKFPFLGGNSEEQDEKNEEKKEVRTEKSVSRRRS